MTALLRWRRVRIFLSGIALRLLAFNLLLVFLPAAGLFYLDTYERHLLEAQERAMVQQARTVAAAAAIMPSLDKTQLDAMFAAMGDGGEPRVRVFDGAAGLVSDSIRGMSQGTAPEVARYEPQRRRDSWLYRTGSRLYELFKTLRMIGRSSPGKARSEPEPVEWRSAPEMKAALAGQYGSATRVTRGGQRSVTLYVAVPIRRDGQTVGAVLASQSTFRLLRALYDVRRRVFAIVVWSMLAASVLSLLTSATIVRPLRRLRAEAASVVARRGHVARAFSGARRHDEIGDLARALEDVTRRLEEHLRFVESFTADLSHEIKNPLASVRTVADTLPQLETEEERARFLDMLDRDVLRMERLIAAVSDLVRVETDLERQAPDWVDLVPIARGLVEARRIVTGGCPGVEFHAPATAAVRGRPDHLAQAVDNLLDNAVSFSPAQGTVTLTITADGDICEVSVRDHGPGLPDAHRERVFERFFSYRPGQPQPRLRHTGLGLAIARTIVESYGGSIDLQNAEGGGACARVRLLART